MAAPGYIIVFSPDVDQPTNFYWNGTQQIALDNTVSPDDAQFYTTRQSARLDVGNLMERFPNQEIAIVPATMAIVATYSQTPQVTAPAAPTT